MFLELTDKADGKANEPNPKPGLPWDRKVTPIKE